MPKETGTGIQTVMVMAAELGRGMKGEEEKVRREVQAPLLKN